MPEAIDPLERVLAARRRARLRRRIAWATAAISAAGVALALLFWPGGSMPAEPMPTPNGYDDLTRGGKLVSERIKALRSPLQGPAPTGIDPARSTGLISYDSPKYIGTADLRDAVERNADALEALRAGLARECRMPTGLLAAGGPGGPWLDASRAPSMLGNVLKAEAALARREARPEGARRSDLDLVRLGAAGPRGGIFNQFWLGLSQEGEGLVGLASDRAATPPDEARRIIAFLAALDAGREPFERVEARTQAYRHFVLSRQQPVLNALYRLDRMIPQPRRAERERVDVANFKDQMHVVVALSRLLTIDLAVRLHRQDRGAYPAGLDALAPGELKAVPLDPFTGRPFVYRMTKDGFLLYSLGPDRRDDGGKPLDPKGGPRSPGDLRFDAPPASESPNAARRSY